jgi:hypothetical protein
MNSHWSELCLISKALCFNTKAFPWNSGHRRPFAHRPKVLRFTAFVDSNESHLFSPSKGKRVTRLNSRVNKFFFFLFISSFATGVFYAIELKPWKLSLKNGCALARGMNLDSENLKFIWTRFQKSVIESFRFFGFEMLSSIETKQSESKKCQGQVSVTSLGGKWDMMSNDESAQDLSRNLVFGGNLHEIGTQIRRGGKKMIESWWSWSLAGIFEKLLVGIVEEVNFYLFRWRRALLLWFKICWRSRKKMLEVLIVWSFNFLI